jgi:glucose/arabinose dehydrogenase
MRRRFQPAVLLAIWLLLTMTAPYAGVEAQAQERCFSETGFCINGRIREFWEQNGGLPVFGYPITPQRAEEIEGQTLQVQWFERNRLELHPENDPPYDVLLGRLGADVLEAQGRDWHTFAHSGELSNCRYFPQTDQSVCGDILASWRAQGLEIDGQPGKSVQENLALFGLPISPVQVERLNDGNEYQVQWFERARFELHPQNQPPFHVQLGLLGTILREGDIPPVADQPDEPPPTSTVWPAIKLSNMVSGFRRPTQVTHAGDGSGRLFVVEQEGTIRIIKDGVAQATPFLDITDRISCCGERGLLSVAFPPDYGSKGYFYVDYTNIDGNSIIARYALGASPDVADPASEQVLLKIEQPYANHNGGQLAFGPDGYLYIGKGDGGSGGDPQGNGQNPDTLLGSILRLDVESGETPYGIPSDNPFVGVAGHRDEIWAYGLRNPWRFSFDGQTGDLYIADVGQERIEEVNVQPASSSGGENYGWNIMEGDECYDAATCDTSGLTMPVATYRRIQGNCSVTGGMVYRGARYANMQGVYFYADYCSGRLWGLRRNGGTWENQLLLEAPVSITSFGEDEAGNLYAVNYTEGTVMTVTE